MYYQNFAKVPYILSPIGHAIHVEKTALIACTDDQTNAAREYYNPDKKIVESDINGEPVLHVGQDKLFPKGNCHKHDCTTCTDWDQCIQPEEIWSKKKKRKKRKNDNPIISEEEKILLKQFRKQENTESYFDIGPINGGAI